jgi:hypothetical protein
MEAVMKCVVAVTVVLLSSAPAFSQVETPSLLPAPERHPGQGSQEPWNKSTARIIGIRRIEAFISRKDPRECDAFGCYWDERIKGYWEDRARKIEQK